jgi:hypothetical protein
MPDRSGPPPFILSALRAQDCRLFSACLHTLTHHTFTVDYSMRFHPTADDELIYPCHRAEVDHELGLQGPADGEPLVQPNLSDGESASGLMDREHRPPPAYTLLHILYHSTPRTCPLLAPLHSLTLHNSSLDFIFGTEDRGFCLTTFIHMSQTLLHPLPLRPDPP